MTLYGILFNTFLLVLGLYFILLCVKIRNEVCANIVPIFGELIMSAILFDES